MISFKRKDSKEKGDRREKTGLSGLTSSTSSTSLTSSTSSTSSTSLTSSTSSTSDKRIYKKGRMSQAPVIFSAAAALIAGFLSIPYLSGDSPGISSAALMAASISFMTPVGDFGTKHMPGGNTPLAVEFIEGEDSEGKADTEAYAIPYIEEASAIEPQALAGEQLPISPVNPTPIKPDNAGNIVKKLYEAGTTPTFLNMNKGFLKNCTDRSAKEVLNIAAQKPKIKIKADGSPEVLIMHTHATESYQTTGEKWFIKGESARTTDNEKNTVRVGTEIEKQLAEAGIGVIHDKTQHDYPSYNGAYERSAATVKRILKENPSIKVVLDVHRDAIQPDNNTIIAPTAEIDGRSCAQVMIISGCENGKLGLPKWQENLKFSAALQRSMESEYSGLTRPILFDYRKYNQDLTTGSILLEMGGHANTLDEAVYCGELVGKSLVKTLLGLK